MLLRRAQFFPRPGVRDSSERRKHAATARLFAAFDTEITRSAVVKRTRGGYIVELEGIDTALSSRQRLSWTRRYIVYRLTLPIQDLLLGRTLSGLTDIAVFLAGRKRAALRY